MLQEKALLMTLQCTLCLAVALPISNADGANFLNCNFNKDKVKESNEA